MLSNIEDNILVKILLDHIFHEILDLNTPRVIFAFFAFTETKIDIRIYGKVSVSSEKGHQPVGRDLAEQQVISYESI